MRCRNWLNELHLQQTLILNRCTNDWCSSGGVASITSQELSCPALCCRSWCLILTEDPAETFQANLSSVVAQAQEQRDPRTVSQVTYKAAETQGFFYSVFFLASGSNNICTHLGKLPKTADGFVAHEGLRSCQEESKMLDWG